MQTLCTVHVPYSMRKVGGAQCPYTSSVNFLPKEVYAKEAVLSVNYPLTFSALSAALHSLTLEPVRRRTATTSGARLCGRTFKVSELVS